MVVWIVLAVGRWGLFLVVGSLGLFKWEWLVEFWWLWVDVILVVVGPRDCCSGRWELVFGVMVARDLFTMCWCLDI